MRWERKIGGLGAVNYLPREAKLMSAPGGLWAFVREIASDSKPFVVPGQAFAFGACYRSSEDRGLQQLLDCRCWRIRLPRYNVQINRQNNGGRRLSLALV